MSLFKYNWMIYGHSWFSLGFNVMSKDTNHVDPFLIWKPMQIIAFFYENVNISTWATCMRYFLQYVGPVAFRLWDSGSSLVLLTALTDRARELVSKLRSCLRRLLNCSVAFLICRAHDGWLARCGKAAVSVAGSCIYIVSLSSTARSLVVTSFVRCAGPCLAFVASLPRKWLAPRRRAEASLLRQSCRRLRRVLVFISSLVAFAT